MEELEFEIEMEGNEDYEIEIENDVTLANDYNLLCNHPKINNVELVGNKTTKDLNIEEYELITNSEIEELLNNFV